MNSYNQSINQSIFVYYVVVRPQLSRLHTVTITTVNQYRKCKTDMCNSHRNGSSL